MANFVGRGAELSALNAIHRDDKVTTVLLTGEAGIGKSRLVHEFSTRLGSEPLVLTGRCLQLGADGLPFAPFISLMRALLRSGAWVPHSPTALACWLPELGPAEPMPDRIRLFGEVLTLLERVASARPLVLVLEDLHWADGSSRELLAFLVANIAEPGILLLGTLRPPADAQIRHLVAELGRAPNVRQVTMSALSRHEVGRQLAGLLEREPEPAEVARVFERSQGNPLFVEALAQSPSGTPAGLEELLLAGVAQLPPDARQLLRVAAVAGDAVEHTLLEAVAGLGEPELHEALRHLVDLRILVAGGTGYTFRHALIRQAAADRLLSTERTRLHAKLAEALRGKEDRLAELAAHAYAAGDLPAAADAAWRAAASAKHLLADAERLHLLERVLQLWDKAALGVDRLTVLQEAAEACYGTGAIDRGIQLATEALAIEESPRLYYLRARLKNLGNTGGRDDLLAALALVPAEPPSVLRAEVLVELAAANVFLADSAGSERDARAALEVAQRLGEPVLAARGYTFLGLASADPAVSLGHFATARSYATGNPNALLAVVLWESAVLISQGKYETAIGSIQDGLKAAHETYQYFEHGPILTVKWVQALTALGRWEQAVELIDETLAEGGLPALSHAALLISRGEIQWAQGNPAAARTAADAAEGLLGAERWVRQYRLKLRALQIRMAPPAQAQQMLADALAADDITTHPNEGWALLVAATSTAAPTLTVTGPVDAAYAATLRATATGDPSTWDSAVQAWRELHQPFELTQSLHLAGEAHLARGDRAAARPMLREAATIAAGLGAEPVVAAVREAAGRAGLPLDEQSTPKAEAPPLPGLTAREMEVLRLVAEGKSNRQIATELFISSNTAGVHVSRILAKLGVATRTEAARRLFDSGALHGRRQDRTSAPEQH